MTDKSLSVDNKPHELKLGASFEPKSGVVYHSIRYDFKPASVDTTQESQVEIGQGHHVTLRVPHVEGSGTTHTVYKGNKRPVSKECVLIIDHDTGTFTLERLTNNINVKKTRMEVCTKPAVAGRPVTPVDTRLKSSPGRTKNQQISSAPPKEPMPPAVMVKTEKVSVVLGEISDSSSDDVSSDSDSDGERDTVDKGRPPVPMTVSQPAAPLSNTKPNGFMSIISADLQLSDSDSDSD